MSHKAIVTGGAGFIGSHLVDRLLRDGHSVVVIDNLATGRLENLAQCQSDPNLVFIHADVSDLSAIESAFNGVDWVFHLAGLADIVPSIQRPLDYHRTNVSGTIAVLEAAMRGQGPAVCLCRFKLLLRNSRSSPYPRNCAAEADVSLRIDQIPRRTVRHALEQTYSLPAISLRLFNVYGPRSRTTGAYGAVFGVFLAQKLARHPFTVVGDGSQTRDFTFVTDVADAFVAAAESDITGEVFNVGSGATQSINRLVGLLGGPVNHIPKRPGEPDCTFADVSKIHAVLGWRR